ncbi:MAG TPA: metallophosphoesterase [Gaiellaceae bacterium]|nr:metallophosphoesterase [Gaiellaceae bacterium]
MTPTPPAAGRAHSPTRPGPHGRRRRTAAAVALACLATLALAGQARADTGILVIGDFGVGGDAELRLGAAVERFADDRPANALVTLGDNDYTERPRAFRRNWRVSFGWAADAGLLVAGTLGNHDVRLDRGRYELELLEMPRPYYRRLVGDVEIFVLASTAIDRPQLAWLERVLARSTAPWKVAAIHHPPYSCGAFTGDRQVRRHVLPLLERHGVKLLLAGHDHNYQRFASREGLTQVVNGGGGAPLYPLSRCPSGFPERAAARETHGFLYLRASQEALRGRAVGISGAIIDRFAVYPYPAYLQAWPT